MATELNELYTEIITHYSRTNKHRHSMDNPDITMRGVNPSCGDDLTFYLHVKDDIIKHVALSGEGCAISQASASIMAELVEGKSIDESKKLIKKFTGMIKKDITDEKELEELGDAVAFENISNMPARVKCAVLAWHTLEEALNKTQN